MSSELLKLAQSDSKWGRLKGSSNNNSGGGGSGMRGGLGFGGVASSGSNSGSTIIGRAPIAMTSAMLANSTTSSVRTDNFNNSNSYNQLAQVPFLPPPAASTEADY